MPHFLFDNSQVKTFGFYLFYKTCKNIEQKHTTRQNARQREISAFALSLYVRQLGFLYRILSGKRI
jgi:hypothetical protein